MGNHKGNKSPLHIIKYWNQYKPKGNRHEMHSIKWVVHVCKISREQMMQRERDDSQRNEQRSYIFRFTQKKKNVTFAKSYPKWPVAREVSHLINSGFSFMSYHLKTTSLPQCVQIFVSEARWPFHVVQLPQNHWLRNNDSLLTVMSTSFDTV